MSCLNVNMSLLNEAIKPTIVSIGEHLNARCSLVCSATFVQEEEGASFAWGNGIRLLWDNGGLILIDK